jgi:hypothetical protein
MFDEVPERAAAIVVDFLISLPLPPSLRATRAGW